MDIEALEQRTRILEGRVRRLSCGLCAIVLASLGILLLGSGTDTNPEKDKTRELTVSRLSVVDGNGRPRIVIGQDAQDVQRISRATGITLYDEHGVERGGFSTLEDGTIVLGMDSPKGVGAAMRDRIGLRVESTGAASIMLINNQTGVPVRLVSEAGGDGGIEFLDYDLEARKARIKRISFGGEEVTEQSLGG